MVPSLWSQVLVNGSTDMTCKVSICVDSPHSKAAKLAKYGAVGMVQVQYDGQVGSNYGIPLILCIEISLLVYDNGEEGIPAVSIAFLDGVAFREHFHGKTGVSTSTQLVLTNTGLHSPYYH